MGEAEALVLVQGVAADEVVRLYEAWPSTPPAHAMPALVMSARWASRRAKRWFGLAKSAKADKANQSHTTLRL